MASTATLSPWTTLNTPSGRPASAHSDAISSDADGSFSDGLSTNVLPQAMASGNIHIGTMAGKLNGVMPATTPTGCRIEYESTLGGDVLREAALEQVRDAAGELDDLQAPRHLARGVGGDLAVLLGDQLGQFGGVVADQLAECEQDRGAPGQRGAAPVRQRVPGRRATARSTSAGLAKSTWPVTCPVAGS